jgi:ADP-heptose:LPS heptosyltransferase
VAPDERHMVVLNPGASDPRRRWSPARFAALGDCLADRGFRVIVSGADYDLPLVEAVCGHMTAPYERVSSLSLGGLGGLLQRSALVVANDSGPLHLARAVGTPTVGIYWCANLITAGPAWRMNHRPVLSWRLNCTLCGQDTIQAPCSHRASFVDDITADEVFNFCLDLTSDQHRQLRSLVPGRDGDGTRPNTSDTPR